MAESRSTLTEFAPHVPTSFPIRAVSALRSAIWVTFIQDNPLTWWWQQGRRNYRADMEGPLYVYGAPNREIEPGKAVLTTIDELKASSPFLLQISVRSPKGDPLPNVEIDLWHATSNGIYSYYSYDRRGRFTTDANGNAEVLTVRPGDYGAGGVMRTGHFHLMLHDAERKYDNLTSQLYVCKGNDPSLVHDFLDYLRAQRPQNVLHAWSVPDSNGGEQFYDFQELPANDVATQERIKWWNDKLAEKAADAGLQVVAGGHTEFTLNVKPGVFGF
ncbi:hypothetical protein PHLGIDRAFT_128806 [Phlebiopsis gigantea 11061_1 CR5-6]|uniref:Intradiol ring-cleavage dioxygenases domain-containing protein n=1 Tax=Phlebiopsis gigantea (strain 11061_1 CR5-6) TaxID=745531 RepID=A0A0C3NKL4_PHLG1|nr:hypothetical protein PHLGIDRAFT_128806 [Phlebiopsis gigantea 11061_1 CR5-6]